MTRIQVQTTPVDKIRFNYIDYTSANPKKYIKILPNNTSISDLTQTILKNDASHYDIYINDERIINLEETLDSFPQPILIRFEKLKDPPINSTFYKAKSSLSTDISYFPNTDELFLEKKLQINADDYYIVYDSDGNEIKITNDNYKDTVKSKGVYYLINYPKKLKYRPDINKKNYFHEIFNHLGLELSEFQQLLCIIFLLSKKEDLRNKISESLQKRKFHPADFVIKSKIDVYDLNFIMSLTFLNHYEGYIKFFQSLLEDGDKIFPVFNSNRLIFNKNIEKCSIIKLNDSYGIFKKFSNDDKNIFEYFDPYEDENKTMGIDFSNIDDPNQITAIFVDTSGTMRIPFDHEGHKRYEAAQQIANKLMDNVRKYDIYDPLFLFTSDKDKVPSDQIPLSLKRNNIRGKTNIWDKLKDLLTIINNEKYHQNCPRHIVVITDGEDTGSESKREDVLQLIQATNVIVDSIILCDDDTSQDPKVFSNYTNGVYLFAKDLKSAEEFVSIEPFFDIKLRKPITKKNIPDQPFDLDGESLSILQKRSEHFLQLDSLNDPHQFYVDYGLLKPSLDRFKEPSENIYFNELKKCIDAEKDYSFYTFLIKDDGKEEKTEDVTTSKNSDIEKEMVKHWCVFIKFDDNDDSYFWQLRIDFDSNYPDSHPKMRIVSHPECIKFKNYISKYGAIKIQEIWKNSVLDTLKNLLGLVKSKDFETEKFETGYNIFPVSLINKHLSQMLNITFEDDWENKADFASPLPKPKASTPHGSPTKPKGNKPSRHDSDD